MGEGFTPEQIRMIEDHEGRRTHPYRDTAGCLTIGVGRNLTARGLAADEIDLLRDNDLRLAQSICTDLFGAGFASWPAARRQALISMAYNLGWPRRAGFRRMRAAIAADDWHRAAAEALASRWAQQTGRRAIHIADLMRAGES